MRRIKEQMGGQDVSKQELAERTGINRITIGRRLRGDFPFTVDELELIAVALAVRFEWLVTGEGNPLLGGPDGGTDQPVGVSEHLSRAAA